MSATRDTKFKKSLELFFRIEKAQDSGYPIHSYEYIDPNTSNKDTHVYNVKITDYSGYLDENFISPYRIVSTLESYYERYGFNRMINGQTRRSSVLLSNPRDIEFQDFRVIRFYITITVNYIRGACDPYPTETLLLDSLLKDNVKLNKQNRQLKNNTPNFQKEDAMLGQIRKMHIAKVDETLDCPVCFIQLDKEKMAIPSTCFHTICGECFVKCKDKCPVCRTKYAKRDVEKVSKQLPTIECYYSSTSTVNT